MESIPGPCQWLLSPAPGRPHLEDPGRLTSSLPSKAPGARPALPGAGLLLLLLLGCAEQGAPEGFTPESRPAAWGSPPVGVPERPLGTCLSAETQAGKGAERGGRLLPSPPLPSLHLGASAAHQHRCGPVHLAPEEGGRFPLCTRRWGKYHFHLRSQSSASGLRQPCPRGRGSEWNQSLLLLEFLSRAREDGKVQARSLQPLTALEAQARSPGWQCNGKECNTEVCVVVFCIFLLMHFFFLKICFY